MALRLFIASAIIYGVYKLLWILLRNYVIRTTTVLNDLKNINLGVRSRDTKFHGTAVIAGGSIGGYLTAHILGEYFTKVVLIETDPRLSAGNGRVGQRLHLHNILPIALVMFRKLFPDFDGEARRAGATIRDGWMRWHLGKRQLRFTPHDSADAIYISRLTLENVVRNLVKKYASSPIEVRQGTVTSINASPDGKLIESISYRPVENPESPDPSTSSSIITIPVAFFADCSGSSSISVKMLPAAGAGWGPFKRYHYNPMVNYRTAHVTIPEKARDAIARAVPQGDIDYGRWDKITMIDVFTPTFQVSNEMYCIQKVDGNQLCLLHCGWDADLARNFSEFVSAVEDIQVKFLGRGTPEKKKAEWVFKVLKIMEDSVEDIDNQVNFVPYKMGQCQWFDFQDAALPANFAPMGDAKMRVNPTFGQGVTKVLGDVVFLNSTLAALLPPNASKIPAETSKEYLKRAFPVAIGMYDINRMLDYGYASTAPQEGETLTHGDWLRRYWVTLLNVAGDDRWAAVTTVNALAGLSPGIDLFHPFLAMKVFLRSWLGPKA